MDNVTAASEGGLSADELRDMVLRLAHEVRNPLATIKAGVQLVQRLTSPTEEIGRHYASILVQVGRIDRTVTAMQRLVRLSGPVPEAVEVGKVVDDLVGTLRASLHRGGVTVAIVPGPPIKAHADPGHLRLALAELLDNAARYSPADARITISWTRGPEGVETSVEDEGPGIATEHSDRIMKPFFSTSNQGTGLGLTIAERVCRLAGGALTWRNLPDRGCRFTMRLPES